VLVFDVTRKVTYQHLSDWYKELREHCENIPCVLVANKIDVDYNVRTPLVVSNPIECFAGYQKRVQICREA
jgi:GTPase SAR1 family protein